MATGVGRKPKFPSLDVQRRHNIPWRMAAVQEQEGRPLFLILDHLNSKEKKGIICEAFQLLRECVLGLQDPMAQGESIRDLMNRAEQAYFGQFVRHIRWYRPDKPLDLRCSRCRPPPTVRRIARDSCWQPGDTHPGGAT